MELVSDSDGIFRVGTRSRVGQLVVRPCPVESLNLEMIHTLRDRWPNRPIGYSGLERSLGDRVKRVYDSELPSRRKLRRVVSGTAS